MKRWLKRVALGVLFTVVLTTLGLTWDWYSTRRAGQKKLDAVIARLDAEDPGWRLHDLNEARNAKLPPDEKNGAVVAAKAVELLPEGYKEWTRQPDTIPADLPPNELLDPSYLAKLDTALAECNSTYQLLRTLPSIPAGGHRLVIAEPNPWDTSLKGTDQTRELSRFLAARVELQLSRNELTGATDDARLLVFVARTISDEPLLISQLVRISVTTWAVKTTERALGCGTPTVGLAELQDELRKEIAVPRLEWGLRGERGMFFVIAEKMDQGVLEGGRNTERSNYPIGEFIYRKYIPDQQAFMAEIFSAAIEAVQLSGPDRISAVRSVMATCPNEYDLSNKLVGLFLPAVEKVNDADTRLVAQLGCAVAGIACERYRQKTGSWPKTLADIPKDILPEIPTDPFTGKSVLFKRTETGAVVYSVGSDGVDDGGEILDPKMPPGTDIGFRLFDPAHRRLPAKPKPPADGEEPK
jgi:hypothetical protein